MLVQELKSIVSLHSVHGLKTIICSRNARALIPLTK